MMEAQKNSARKISIMIVDDHPLLRLGVGALINARRDMEVVAQPAPPRKLSRAMPSSAPTSR